jgi:hypothetical protein
MLLEKWLRVCEEAVQGVWRGEEEHAATVARGVLGLPPHHAVPLMQSNGAPHAPLRYCVLQLRVFVCVYLCMCLCVFLSESFRRVLCVYVRQNWLIHVVCAVSVTVYGAKSVCPQNSGCVVCICTPEYLAHIQQKHACACTTWTQPGERA